MEECERGNEGVGRNASEKEKRSGILCPSMNLSARMRRTELKECWKKENSDGGHEAEIVSS